MRGGADEVEEARLRAPQVTLRALLVECILFQLGVVVGAHPQLLDIRGSTFKLAAKISHGAGEVACVHEGSLDSTRSGWGQRDQGEALDLHVTRFEPEFP